MESSKYIMLYFRFSLFPQNNRSTFFIQLKVRARAKLNNSTLSVILNDEISTMLNVVLDILKVSLVSPAPVLSGAEVIVAMCNVVCHSFENNV
jgi:hypothetical protein